MKRHLLVCGVSAALGAAAAIVWLESDLLPNAQAQPPAARNRDGRVTPPASGPLIKNMRVQDDEDLQLTPEEQINVAVYDRSNRSVVNLDTKTVQRDLFMFATPSQGAGSGLVIDRQGHILTNYHVIEGAREINVTLYNGKTYRASLVGRDESTDVAVIKIEAPKDSLYPVEFGNSTHLKVGQRVYAIGNPFGLERTLTTGIISSLNRSLPTRNHRVIKQIIQTDAAINPGNSGGPLLDTHGRLIGMNTAIASRTGQNTGVGFAIPVSALSRVVPELIRHGRVIRPETGISRVFETEHGLIVASVARGGPAESAGLKGFRLVRERRRQGPFVYEIQRIDRSQADLIVAVDGKPVKTVDEFLTRVEKKRPGETVVLTIIRGGKKQDLQLQLGASDS